MHSVFSCGSLQRSLVPMELEPMLLEGPSPAQDRAVLLVHAPGESRSGNNFLMSLLARHLAKDGFLTGRFDLAGQGDSISEVDVEVWCNQVAEGVTLLKEAVEGGPVHVVAHGASAGLLAQPLPVSHRVAVGPPTADEVLALAQLAVDGVVVGQYPCPVSQVRLWEVLGAEPNLIGGLCLPARELQRLAERLREVAWDTEIGPRTRHAQVLSSIIVAEEDVLLRLEAVRFGAAFLLGRHLLALS